MSLRPHREVVIQMAGYTAMRDAFQMWVEEGMQSTETLEVEGEEIPLEGVLEALDGEQALPPGIRKRLDAEEDATFEDIMPSGVCAELDLPQGSSYTDGVAVVRRRLDG
jgi:hypothetical protein